MNPTVENLKRVAVEALRQQHFVEAEQWLAAALQLAPATPDLLFLLGTTLAQTGKADQAIQFLDAARAAQPDHVPTLNNLATVLRQQGRLEEAVVPLRHALLVQPKSADTLVNLGHALKALGRIDQARECAHLALKLKPDHIEALILAGVVLLEQGKPDDARRCFERAAALKPDGAAALHGLGLAHAAQGELKAAAQDLVRAIALAPQQPAIHLSLAETLLAAGDYPDGSAEYEWRWQTAAGRLPELPAPLWDGNPLPPGQTLLLWCESGAAEAIQMIRFAHDLHSFAERIVVTCPAPLMRLFRSCKDIDEVVPLGGELGEKRPAHAGIGAPGEPDLESGTGQEGREQLASRRITREIGVAGHRIDGDAEPVDEAAHREVRVEERQLAAERHDLVDVLAAAEKAHQGRGAGDDDAFGEAMQIVREADHLDCFGGAAFAPQQQRLARRQRVPVPQRRRQFGQAASGGLPAPFIFGAAVGVIASSEQRLGKAEMDGRLLWRQRDGAHQILRRGFELALRGMSQSETVQSGGAVGLQRRGAFETTACIVGLTLFQQHHAGENQRFDVIGLELERQVGAFAGLIDAAQRLQRVPQIDQRVGRFRLYEKGVPQRHHRFLEAALLAQHGGKIVQRRDVIGLRRPRRVEELDRLIGLAGLRQCRAEEEKEIRRRGRKLQRRGEPLFCLDEVLLAQCLDRRAFEVLDRRIHRPKRSEKRFMNRQEAPPRAVNQRFAPVQW